MIPANAPTDTGWKHTDVKQRGREAERQREEGKHFPRFLTAAMALIEWVDTERVTMERVQHTVLNTQQL